MVTYYSTSDASLANVLTYLTNNKIGPGRIVNIFYAGTSYVAVFVAE